MCYIRLESVRRHVLAAEAMTSELHELDRRVARLEGASPHLATKADLQALEATMIKWLVGVGIALLAVIVPLLLYIISRLP